jgi:hypothetical protein
MNWSIKGEKLQYWHGLICSNGLTVVFDLGWHVEVDNVLNVWKIKTFCGYISCNQHILFAFFEELDSFVTFFLIFTTMDTNRFDAF